MKKLSGFSLMEMMIVLLIVSVIAGATAPMINKKLMTAASEKSPWVWIGQNNDIGYNLGGKNITASIGTTETSSSGARLFIKSKDPLPHIELKDESSDNTWEISTIANSFSIIPSNFDQPGANAIMIGGNANSGATAVGFGAQATGDNAIALGCSAQATGDNAIVLGTNAKANNNSLVMGTGAQAAGSSIAIGIPEIDDDGVMSNHVNAGISSIAFGLGALARTMDSIAIGHSARIRTSDNSIAIGHGARIGFDSDENYGNDNAIAIGHNTRATVKRSIAIGEQAFASGTNSIAIGSTDADDTVNHWYPEAARTNSIAIGTRAKALHKDSVAIGPGAKTNTSNQIVLGNSDTTVYIPGKLLVDGTIFTRLIGNAGGGYALGVSSGLVTAISGAEVLAVWNDQLSDRRLKNVGKAFKGGLEEIKKLEVFNYTFKKDKSKTPRVGVMAQDLEKIFPSAVTKGEDGFLRIRMEDMFYALVNAVKELDAKFDLLAQKQKKIDELEDKVSKLELENKEFAKRLLELEKKIK